MLGVCEKQPITTYINIFYMTFMLIQGHSVCTPKKFSSNHRWLDRVQYFLSEERLIESTQTVACLLYRQDRKDNRMACPYAHSDVMWVSFIPFFHSHTHHHYFSQSIVLNNLIWFDCPSPHWLRNSWIYVICSILSFHFDLVVFCGNLVCVWSLDVTAWFVFVD